MEEIRGRNREIVVERESEREGGKEHGECG